MLVSGPGCSDEPVLCASEEPSFQVDVLPGDGVNVSSLRSLHVTVKAGSFQKKNVKFSIEDELDDGRTSFVVVLGQAGAVGFTAEVLVLAKDVKGKVLAWAKKTFSGTGDACNFFLMTLEAGEPGAVDLDGDGETGATDCDDNDPCRSHKLTEEPNLCKVNKTAFAALPAACKAALAAAGKSSAPPHCGDGIDQDCDGKDSACVKDADCDGYSPPGDCKDDDKAINPGAKELCDGVDNNCDKVTDEGCAQCDVDGDGYASPLATGTACKVPKTDDDDFDAGINPGITKDTGGKEGGTVKAALRQLCSYSETKNSTSTTVVRHRDLDHDGDKLVATADGCPAKACKTGKCGWGGACKLENKKNGTSCSGGKCYKGSCCKGCWDGGTCQLGKNVTKCGSGGQTCGKCAVTTTCKTASCATGSCVTVNKANGTTCGSSSNSGTCLGGTCCTGCVSGSVCKSGGTTSFCGVSGMVCDACTSGDKCKSGVCLPIKP